MAGGPASVCAHARMTKTRHGERGRNGGADQRHAAEHRGCDRGLLAARERMRKHGIRRMPVVRDGELVGIVTDRDVRQAWASPATALSTHELLYLLEKVMVGQIMTPTCSR